MSTIIYGLTRKSKEKHLVTKEDPFFAPIKHRVLLNKEGSSKKTFHISLDITNSSILYHEGDAIGIWPQNDPVIVASIMTLLNASSQAVVQDPRSEQSLSFKDYLYHKANLSRVTPALLQFLSTTPLATPKITHLQHLLDPSHQLLRTAYFNDHDVLTCLKEYTPQITDLQGFVNTLAPLLPRFYSIASSQTTHPNELHLLVSTFTYRVQDELRTGLGSHFLCYHANASVPLYVQHNPNFALPSNPETPIIMIGPGTGVAPFRAFLQKRASLPLNTRNWLFFGECNRAYDFYYEEEFSHYVQEGLLTLSTAFSRDQSHKIYVQHELERHGQEVWSWVNEGAHIYLCGDATHMAKDVTHALLMIFQTSGKLSIDDSKALLHHLRKTKRFQTDVY